MVPHEHEVEELILKESIVSATGLRADALQIGIKGDPSLRESALLRPKYRNVMDEVFEKIAPNAVQLRWHAVGARGEFRKFLAENISV